MRIQIDLDLGQLKALLRSVEYEVENRYPSEEATPPHLWNLGQLIAKGISDYEAGVISEKSKEEEFADKATDVLFKSLSKLPPEEQDRRINAFTEAVDRRVESKKSEEVGLEAVERRSQDREAGVRKNR